VHTVKLYALLTPDYCGNAKLHYRNRTGNKASLVHYQHQIPNQISE